MLKKFAVWAGIAFLVFMTAFQPGVMWNAVKLLGRITIEIFKAVGEFFAHLAS